MPSPPNKTSKSKKLASLVFTLAWLVLVALVFTNRQGITDWWKLHNYQAPADIAAIADQTTMTDYGRKAFYVNHPAIEAKTEFFKECPNGEREQTIVLGCYHSVQAGIFVLDVNDERLNGVEQVTAAHEMLHAAYDRLGAKERSRVDKLLRDYYKNHLDDQRISQTIDAYKKSEPNDLVNEMHSIFGTEIADLPAPLEQYYKKYFNDRSKVAGYAAQYQAEFTSRQSSIKSYDGQLELLKSQIDDLQANIKVLQSQINSQRDDLDARRRSGDTAGYNAGVPAYNQLVSQYNAEADQIRNLITRYNNLVAERNEVARQYGELTKELSSDVEPLN